MEAGIIPLQRSTLVGTSNTEGSNDKIRAGSREWPLPGRTFMQHSGQEVELGTRKSLLQSSEGGLGQRALQG